MNRHFFRTLWHDEQSAVITVPKTIVLLSRLNFRKSKPAFCVATAFSSATQLLGSPSKRKYSTATRTESSKNFISNSKIHEKPKPKGTFANKHKCQIAILQTRSNKLEFFFVIFSDKTDEKKKDPTNVCCLKLFLFISSVEIHNYSLSLRTDDASKFQ
jgi:hypothetical protein